MPRSWLRPVFLTSGVIALVATLAPWVVGTFVILAAGSGEYVSVRDTGMVTCPDVLHWSEWTDGAGSVRRGYFAENIDPDATIVAHRVGTDSKLFARLTLYQAKYQHADGRIEFWAANGPRPIVSRNESAAAICSGSFLLLAIVSFILASRCKVE